MTNTAERPEPARSSRQRAAASGDAREALLDAAQRLLVEVGYPQVTTRRLAAAAGVNQGLIHYYFGSIEELLFQAFERFSQALLERQRALYAGSAPFVAKWRAAMRYLDSDLAAGYPKIGLELAALGWNQPRFRARTAAVLRQWRRVLTEAFEAAASEYGLDRRRFPVEAMVTLVMTFNLGYMVEELSGLRDGHKALLAMIDRWLVDLEVSR